VSDVVMMGRYDHQGWIRGASRADREVVARSLAQMGITALANRSISELSGGEQQRAFLARALAQEPHILLMDEPFTGVDLPTQKSTMELLDDLRAEDVTAMIATHDLGVAIQKFDLILLINHRLVAFGPPAEVMKRDLIAQAFGEHLTTLPDGSVIVNEH
jgi:manganese/iron transport system ATP-binding protein/manganese/zinc/iron transport system ATP- binding protein